MYGSHGWLTQPWQASSHLGLHVVYMLGAIFCQSKDSYRPGGFLGCPAGQMPCTYGGNWKNLCSAMSECPVSLRETSVESNLSGF